MTDLLATGFFEVSRSVIPVGGGIAPWLPRSFVNKFVDGISPDDNTFALNGASTDLALQMWTDFKLQDLPSTLTALKFHYRFRTSFGDVDNIFFNLRIHFSQGQPVHDYFASPVENEITNGFHLINWTIQPTPTGPFHTFTETIPIINITNTKDIWISLMGGPRFTLAPVSDTEMIVKVSWLVVEATFVVAVEVPTSIPYGIGLSIMSLPILTQVGASGSTTWKYRVVPCNASGCGIASEEVAITDGNAVLDETNFICITFNDVDGATSYKVYRTSAGGTPSTTGLIGTLIGSGEGTCGEDDGFGGSGAGGFKDEGQAPTEDFDEALCEDVDSITIPAKETPVSVVYPSREVPV